ncbi:hypothetical protein Hdeb2414_s0007g00243801 [Helianthus debilis subsp. tardiflorus]
MNSESTSDMLLQYVVLRRDLVDTWSLGSVITQGFYGTRVIMKILWSNKLKQI